MAERDAALLCQALSIPVLRRVTSHYDVSSDNANIPATSQNEKRSQGGLVILAERDTASVHPAQTHSFVRGVITTLFESSYTRASHARVKSRKLNRSLFDLAERDAALIPPVVFADGYPRRDNDFYESSATSISQPRAKMKKGPKGGLVILAERVGFEPTRGYEPLPVFKTGAFDRSATSPKPTSGNRNQGSVATVARMILPSSPAGA